MTELSPILPVRRRVSGDRFGHRLQPVWSVVVLAFALWGATWCAAADVNWVGQSRDDVVEQLGRPLSALQRGDTEILMYANGVRFEVRNGMVVAHRLGSGAMIVAGDGTRYTPTDRGKLQRVVPPPVAEASVETVDDVAPATTLAEPATDEPVETAMINSAGDEAESWTSQPADNTVPLPLPAAAKSKNLFATSPEEIAEHGVIPSIGQEKEQEKKTPGWVRPVQEIVGALLRFGFAFLMLRIAISWVELPCYNPDVAKVAALYVVIREGLHGLARLGGHWEWITLFRIDDGLSYLAMMYLLFKFKVALSGITALKIATATKAATYLLMAIFTMGFAFVFGGFF